MLSIKDYLFEIQFLLDIFIITALVILAFLYIKLSAAKKSNQLVNKIEYLCNNLKTLVEQTEESADTIHKKIEEFKALYNKNTTEIEKQVSILNEIINKIERNENISDKMQKNDKYAKVKSLLSEGHDINTIAKMLRVNKGEVELISNIIKQTR